MKKHKLLAMLLLAVASMPSHADDQTNPNLAKIVWCESRDSHYWESDGWLNHRFHHKGDLKCGDDGVSCGIGQFSKTTFYWLVQKLHMKNKNWLNEKDQLEVMNAALNAGYGKHWSCYWKVVMHRRLVVRWIHGKKHYIIVK